MRTLIAKSTDAKAKFAYLVTANATRPVTLQVDGALASETITVKGAGIDESDETTLYDSAGDALVLSAITPVITFYASVRLSITKPETTNAVGLMELQGR